MTFDQLNLLPLILKAVHEEGYEKPTPIQAQAIPELLKGKDLLGCAQTGTGKTAAFAIPILQILTNAEKEVGRKKIKSLILTPTRELAIQIDESFKAYGRHLKLVSTVIFGGVPQGAQTQALQRGTDILIATPGRLLDLIQQGFVKLSDLRIFVLDEADRMLDMGFVHDVKKVIALLPAKRQSLFFSATMPGEIQTLANTILTQPVMVEVTPVSSTAEKIEQQMFLVEKNDKINLLQHLLKQEDADSVLVFSRTKHGADKVVRLLHKAGFSAAAIHGNKSQNARQHALLQFKTGKIRILVATDIAARGIDIDELSLVINYDLPDVPETYVHRIGRTARAGKSGKAYSFCSEDERENLRDIQKLIKMDIALQSGHPYESEVPQKQVKTASAPPKKTVPTNPGPKKSTKKPWFKRSSGPKPGNTSG
jgi:ATP-dependent RNA helicase RhlE